MAIENTEDKMKKMQKQIDDLTVIVNKLNNEYDFTTQRESSFNKRKIIRQEYQFIGKVYDRNGNVVTEINP